MARAAEVHAALRALPVLSIEEAFPAFPLLVVAPHQDDESLGCGGLIAACADHRRPVHVAFLTDGAASHPNSRAYPPERLAALRQDEALAACAALGVGRDGVTFMGLPDGRAPHRGRAFDHAAERISAIARDTGARTIVAAWQHDPHGDHVSANRLSREAAYRTGAAFLSYPVWAWNLPADAWLPDAIDGFRIDIGPYTPRKFAAIHAHRSQTTGLIDDDPTGFRLEPAMLRNFEGPFEVFIRD